MTEYFLFYENVTRRNSHPPNRSLSNVMRQVEKTERRERIRCKVAQQKRKQRGAVLILCMIFLCVFSVFAVALCSRSVVNLQIAKNQHDSNRARAAAESGLEATKYWMVNDCNGFTGISHVLSRKQQQRFKVEIFQTTDPNTLAVIVTGTYNDFKKAIGGNFVNVNPGWQFANETYREK